MIQGFNASALPFEKANCRAPRLPDEVSELIQRYPNLSEIELARLINQFRELSALEMALMLSDEALAPCLDRFSADHRSRIRPPFRQYAALLVYAAVGLAVLVWAAVFRL